MFCTLLGSNGNNVVAVTSLSQCDPSKTAYLSASELSALMQQASSAASQSSLTVAELFAVPSVPDLQNIFMQGFSLPCTVYLVSWVYGQLLSFIEDSKS
jgi:hypothetical protein